MDDGDYSVTWLVDEVPHIGLVLYPGQACLHLEEGRQPAAT